MAEKRDYLRKYQFNRYQTKRFRNPYFRGTSKPKTSLRPKQWLTMMLVLGGIIGFVYLIGFAPFWMIRQVRVEGLTYMDPSTVTDAVNHVLDGHRWLIIPERNRLFFHKAEAIQLLSQESSFESLNLSVEKGVVVVRVKERVSQVLWSSAGQTYYADEQGTVIRMPSESDQANLAWHGSTQPFLNSIPLEGPYPQVAQLSSMPLLINKDDEDAQPGDLVLTPASIGAVININALLSQNGLPTKDFLVEHTDSIWVSARLLAGFDVLFDTTVDAQSQINYLNEVLQKQVPDRSVLDYVDVRFGNHVYFKTR